ADRRTRRPPRGAALGRSRDFRRSRRRLTGRPGNPESRPARPARTCDTSILHENGGRRMEFDQVIRGRRSIRGYRKRPVPKALIREILELAMRAPTSLNTQPWNFFVVAGAVLDRIRNGNVERNLAGVPDSRE